MRKFTLLKEYPGSGAVGTISQPNDLLQHDFFEKYSEYWQEIKQGDYQIISFTSTVVWNGKAATLLPNGQYSTNPEAPSGWTLHEMLNVGVCVKNGNLQIHSVKRISDGEIFTIGDRAKTITSKGSHTITQFRIRQYCTGKSSDGYTYDGVDRIWIDWEKDCGGNWLEFTEKIIERDFEILNEIAKYDPKNEYKQAGSRITSIKRLSDGEIFTVGDKFKANIGGSDVVRTIQKIEVKGDVITIHQENGWLTNEIEDGGIFHEITKYVEPKPLLITEDGVPVYSYDSVQHWVINGSYEYAIGLCKRNVDLLRDEPKTYKVFSTEKAARDYVRKNTPIFTTEDGVKIFKGDIYWFVDTDFSISMVEALHGCGEYSERKYFSTFELAEDYVIKNAKLISIEDFNNAIASQYGNYNIRQKLIQIAKQRLVRK